MSEDPPSTPPRSWFERITQALSGEPQSREELIEELRHAQANGLLSNDTLSMVEGAIEVADLTVSDVMDLSIAPLPTDPTCKDPMVVNCVAYAADGRRLRDITVEEISDVLETPDEWVWVGVREPSEDLLDKLREEFGLHEGRDQAPPIRR